VGATKLLVTAALATAFLPRAFGADTSLGPPPQFPRPLLCPLQDSPVEPLSAQPAYRGKPLYGALRLGDSEDNVFSVAVDLAPDWQAFRQAYKAAQGKVELSSVPARIYLDANRDRDLTNDDDGGLSRCVESDTTPGSFMLSRIVDCTVPYADGARVKYPIRLVAYPQRPKEKARDGSDIDFARTLLYHTAASFQGRLTVGDAELSVRFLDRNCDGLIALEDKDSLVLDLNQDGVLDENPRGPEVYALDQPFLFGGQSWVLSTYGARGGDPTVVRSDQSARTPVYLVRGVPAPDFTAPTLDGGTFTLSAQKGKVVVLEFWATWCPDCAAQLPATLKLWQDLKGEGLALVGISLDEDDAKGTAAAKVARFTAEKGMTWTHLVGGRGWSSPVADLYQVIGIPHRALIGRDGNLIAVGLEGERLNEEARKALAEP